MWFATQHGVDRYDGYEFRLFKNDPAQPNSPCGVLMLSLFKDRSGTLWMGCEHGLDRFEPTTEAFVHYEFDPGTTDVVRHISEDPQRNAVVIDRAWLGQVRSAFQKNHLVSPQRRGPAEPQ